MTLRNKGLFIQTNNPTQFFEKRMSELEEGEDVVAFASGMGAISSVLLSLLSRVIMLSP